MRDLSLFEVLTGGAFDRLNWQHSGKFDQNFSKKVKYPGVYPGGHGRFWNSPVNNAGTFRRKGRALVLAVTKPEICTRFDRYWYGRFLEGFLALSFDFLHFIYGSTIGFSMKIERLITGEKKVDFSCISTSSAVTATPYIFWGKVCGKNWQGVMIVVRSYW